MELSLLSMENMPGLRWAVFKKKKEEEKLAIF